MFRILAPILALLALVVTAMSAQAHDRGDFLYGAPSGTMEAVMKRGYGIYHLDARANTFPKYREELWKRYAHICEVTRVCWYEDWTIGATEYDLLWSMPDTWQWGDGAAGVCVSGPGYYKTRVEVNWRKPYASFDTTNVHEEGHCGGAAQEDLYFHPLTCDPSAKWTRMSCGTGVATITEYDLAIVWNAYVPDIPSEVGMFCNSTWCWVQYNSIRAGAVNCTPSALAQRYRAQVTEQDNYCGHFSPYLDNITQVAIFVRAPGGDWQFVVNGPAPKKNSWDSRGFLRADWCGKGLEFAVRPTSNLQLTWHPMHGGVSFLTADLAIAGSC